jgi:hypothetical protein
VKVPTAAAPVPSRIAVAAAGGETSEQSIWPCPQRPDAANVQMIGPRKSSRTEQVKQSYDHSRDHYDKPTAGTATVRAFKQR